MTLHENLIGETVEIRETNDEYKRFEGSCATIRAAWLKSDLVVFVVTESGVGFSIAADQLTFRK